MTNFNIALSPLLPWPLLLLLAIGAVAVTALDALGLEAFVIELDMVP